MQIHGGPVLKFVPEGGWAGSRAEDGWLLVEGSVNLVLDEVREPGAYETHMYRFLIMVKLVGEKGRKLG